MLVFVSPGAEAASSVRIGSTPESIQNEPTYAAREQADELRFLFQFNEEGGPSAGTRAPNSSRNVLGSLHLHGRLDKTRRAGEFVAGFLDF